MSSRDWFELRFADAGRSFARHHAQDFGDWEVRLVGLAIDNGLLDWDNHLLRVPKQKTSYNMFTLNREYFIQLAAFSALVKDYNYPPENCLVEYHSMDILVVKKESPYICVEAKVKDSDIEKLLRGISGYSNEVPPARPNVRDDALRKANYLRDDKPSFFWLVTANQRRAFSVVHHDGGFALSAIGDIPKYTDDGWAQPVAATDRPSATAIESMTGDETCTLPGKNWDEVKFTEHLSRKNVDAASTAREILGSLRHRNMVVRWGRGRVYGSFGPELRGTNSLIFTVWTNGFIQVHFQNIRQLPSMNDATRRLELLQRINKIPGVKLPDDSIDKYPTFPISALNKEVNLKIFLDSVDWLTAMQDKRIA